MTGLLTRIFGGMKNSSHEPAGAKREDPLTMVVFVDRGSDVLGIIRVIVTPLVLFVYLFVRLFVCCWLDVKCAHSRRFTWVLHGSA